MLPLLKAKNAGSKSSKLETRKISNGGKRRLGLGSGPTAAVFMGRITPYLLSTLQKIKRRAILCCRPPHRLENAGISPTGRVPGCPTLAFSFRKGGTSYLFRSRFINPQLVEKSPLPRRVDSHATEEPAISIRIGPGIASFPETRIVAGRRSSLCSIH